MSRAEPTAEELAAGRALEAFFTSAGHQVANLLYEDSPDIRMTVDGEAVAVECVQVPPSSVLRWVHTRFKQITAQLPGAAAVQVVWPREVHVWVAEAIAAKERKFDDYCARLNSDAVDLLIHAPIAPGTDAVRSSDPSVRNQIRWGAHQADTRFRRIYFWDGREHVELIRPTVMQIEEPTFDFSQGYPTDGFILGSVGPFTTTEAGAPPVEYDFGIVVPEVIIVPPVSDEFRAHEPRYRSRRVRCRVVAYDTRADARWEDV